MNLLYPPKTRVFSSLVPSTHLYERKLVLSLPQETCYALDALKQKNNAWCILLVDGESQHTLLQKDISEEQMYKSLLKAESYYTIQDESYLDLRAFEPKSPFVPHFTELKALDCFIQKHNLPTHHVLSCAFEIGKAKQYLHNVTSLTKTPGTKNQMLFKRKPIYPN